MHLLLKIHINLISPSLIQLKSLNLKGHHGYFFGKHFHNALPHAIHQKGYLIFTGGKTPNSKVFFPRIKSNQAFPSISSEIKLVDGW